MTPFYVRVGKSPNAWYERVRHERELEVFKRALANGAYPDMSRRAWGVKSTSITSYEYKYCGVDDFGDFIFSNYVHYFGNDAVELNDKELRELYPLPEGYELPVIEANWKQDVITRLESILKLLKESEG